MTRRIKRPGKAGTDKAPNSLLHRTGGYAARAVRRALGMDERTERQRLERRVLALERQVAAMRPPAGAVLGPGDSIVIGLDHMGRLWLNSSDETVLLDPVAGRPYGIDIRVNPEAIETGCADALLGIVDCAEEAADISGCGGRLEFHPGSYVAAKKDPPDQVGNIAVRLELCHPEQEAMNVAPSGTPFTMGQPPKWVKMPLGDPCEGDCVEWASPIWPIGGQ